MAWLLVLSLENLMGHLMIELDQGAIQHNQGVTSLY